MSNGYKPNQDPVDPAKVIPPPNGTGVVRPVAKDEKSETSKVDTVWVLYDEYEDLRLEIEEAKGMLGNGGDGTLKGRIEFPSRRL